MDPHVDKSVAAPTTATPRAPCGLPLTKTACSLAAAGLLVLASVGALAGAIVGTARARADGAAGGVTRDVYLAAEETLWDYAPSAALGANNCSGAALTEAEGVFLWGEADGGAGAGLIGRQYHKRTWREYTDAGFTVRAPHDPAWAHAGFYGPVLRAAVGDTLRVHVLNRSRYPVSFHVLGLTLSSVTVGGAEGAPAGGTYKLNGAAPPAAEAEADSSTLRLVLDPFSAGFRSSTCAGGVCAPGSIGLNAAPGATAAVTYEWLVPATAGPAEGETTDTVARLYQSLAYDAHELSLSGVVIVSRPGGGGHPASHVARELLALFSVSNENESPYLHLNILDFILRPRYANGGSGATAVWPAAVERASAVFPLYTVEHASVLAALYNAAAVARLGAAAPLVDAGDAVIAGALGQDNTVASLNDVPIGVTFDADGGVVDTSVFVATYGQTAAEEALAPLLSPVVLESDTFDADLFDESNLMHSLGGYLYCNQPALVMPGAGGTARWYVGVIGTEVDMHTAHWHGNVLNLGGHHTDAIQLLPRAMVTADMTADNTGTWLFHCHVTDHIHAGMVALYHVDSAASAGNGAGDPHANHGGGSNDPAGAEAPPPHLATQLSGATREYFIASEVVQWDATHPDGAALCAAAPGAVTLAEAPPVVTKARYIQYTDATFTQRTPVAPEWEHLALLGPVIRAEVGDTLHVTFLNRSPRGFSVHPHGVLYAKRGEGAPYADGTEGEDKHDDEVPTNGTWTYTWFVPESAGPGPTDGDSILWLYHGHVHEVEDENLGMLGAIIVTARGKATTATNLRPVGVDREFVLLFKVFEPVDMGAADHNHSVVQRRMEAGGGGEEEPPLLHSINGMVQCGVTGLHMRTGERVRWYLASLGNEIDVSICPLGVAALVNLLGHT
jgi:FtsP/CotA-like multicopper oxidase with cupredoxin domain